MNRLDIRGFSPLAMACGKGDKVMATLLIETFGANVETGGPTSLTATSSTPLGQAVKNGHLDMVTYLLSLPNSPQVGWGFSGVV